MATTSTVPIADQANAALYQARVYERLEQQAENLATAVAATGRDLSRRLKALSLALDEDAQDIAARETGDLGQWIRDIANDADDGNFHDGERFRKAVEVALERVS